MALERLVPSRKVVIVALVALLVVTSGCAGLLGDDGNDSNDSNDGTENGMENGNDNTNNTDDDMGDSDDDMNNTDDDMGDGDDDMGDGDDDMNNTDDDMGDGDDDMGDGDDDMGDGDDDMGDGDDDMGDGDDDMNNTDDQATENIDKLASVPESSNVVMFFDGEIFRHQTTVTLVDGIIQLNESMESLNDTDGFDEIEGIEDGDSYQDALDLFANETGTNISAFNSVTLFGNANAETDPAEANDQAGIILDTDWTWEELTSALDVTVDEQFQDQRTYAGETVYVNESTSDGETTWVADVGDGTFILGDEANVKASLDTRAGNNPALSGPIKQAYTNIGEGFLKVAVNVTEEQAGDMGDPQIITMRYGADGDMVFTTVQVEMATSEQAKQIPTLVNFFLAEFQNEDAPPEVQDAIETFTSSVETSSEGTTATVELRIGAQEFINLLETLDNAEQTMAGTN